MAATLRTIQCTRYVTPLREGGSLPAIVEADDLGLYVMKFKGAGQGTKALIAELIGGELARTLGLPMPELVFMELGPALARLEGDDEIRDLLKASCGLNLAVDYLPGSITYEPAAEMPVDGKLASSIVWLDAVITNVDRTVRNTNLLWWHDRLWLIDHGAAIYAHHAWERHLDGTVKPFTAIKDHVLLRFALELEAVNATLRPLLTRARIEEIIQMIPDDWLANESQFPDVTAHRNAYIQLVWSRIEASDAITREAVDARASRV